MYSEKDDIADSVKIEEFIKERKRRVVNVDLYILRTLFMYSIYAFIEKSISTL